MGPRSVLHDQSFFFHFFFLNFLSQSHKEWIRQKKITDACLHRTTWRITVRPPRVTQWKTRRYHIPPSIGQGVVLGEILRPAMQLVRQVSAHLRSRWNGL